MWVLQIHDKRLPRPVMSVEWGGETEWQNRLWLVLVYLIWVCVCFCLSMSVGTMALLRCWESQAPWCLACWTGVSKGTFGWIRWPLCPFQVWLLHDRTSNMNLEAIKDGWIAGCPPPPHPPSLHTNYTGLLVLSIICDTFCADGTVILFQCAISLVQGICVLTHQSKIH